MRIFITGATGYVGGAVAENLLERGHEVAALVRPQSDSKALRDRGATIVLGDLGDLGNLADLAHTLSTYEVLVHAAVSAGRDAVARDRIAVDVFTATNAFVVYTSGVWVCGQTGERVADEKTPVNPLPLVAWRPPHEQRVLASGHGAVLRPGCVYGGKQSLLAGWFAAAAEKRPLQIVGEGRNRWAMVNLHDVADCYLRVIEQKATGTFHAVDDTRSTLNDCAKTFAPDGSIEHVPVEVARQKMGPFTDALVADQMISSEATRRQLRWTPRRTFLTSLDEQWREWREVHA
jgi:nucleoside-diphosphate-sugar epimerase